MSRPGHRHRWLMLLALASAPAACKKNQAVSDVDTLDNFARTGGVKINRCAGAFPVSPSARFLVDRGDPHQVEAAGRRAIAAIPPRLQKVFFENDKGAFVANDRFTKTCIAALGNVTPFERRFAMENTDAVNACTEHIDPLKSVLIRLRPNAVEVSHFLVRTFALHFGSTYAPKVYKNWDASTFNLSMVFMDEVNRSKSFTIAPYVGMFATTHGKKMFQQFVFAEAFDSYYCNAETKASFSKNFPRTFKAFATLARSFE